MRLDRDYWTRDSRGWKKGAKRRALCERNGVYFFFFLSEPRFLRDTRFLRAIELSIYACARREECVGEKGTGTSEEGTLRVPAKRDIKFCSWMQFRIYTGLAWRSVYVKLQERIINFFEN